jgi:predicted 2-oxoglutarate/Fe(II)-dependent dioxygenase YbiX|tara:strand:- start:128 stop:691 length:564 start_codon:yes stop_codon:yes gene_type:complete
MRLEDFIHVEKNAISDELCRQIIDEYDDSDDWKAGTINDYEINEYRKCEVVYLSQDETLKKNLKTRNKIDDELYKIISNLLEKYLKKYDSLGYVQIKEDTGYMLLRYKTGDYVKKHVDTSSDQHRTLSCSLILNDDYEGGEITFLDGEIKPNLKKGDLLIFPSSFTYPHQVLPVTSGTRYSIITWIR